MYTQKVQINLHWRPPLDNLMKLDCQSGKHQITRWITRQMMGRITEVITGQINKGISKWITRWITGRHFKKTLNEKGCKWLFVFSWNLTICLGKDLETAICDGGLKSKNGLSNGWGIATGAISKKIVCIDCRGVLPSNLDKGVVLHHILFFCSKSSK